MWRNCYTTTFKQIGKQRTGSKTIRKHEKILLTSCERLRRYCTESGDDASAEYLRAAWRLLHNPFELKAWIEKRLKLIWKLDAALTVAGNEGEASLEGWWQRFVPECFPSCLGGG